MSFPSWTQPPTANLDYTEDWTAWLATGETITACTITADTGITASAATITSGVKVTTWVTGGTVGQTYNVVFHVTTNQTRQDERTIRINITPR